MQTTEDGPIKIISVIGEALMVDGTSFTFAVNDDRMERLRIGQQVSIQYDIGLVPAVSRP